VPAPPLPTPDEVQRALERVYSRPELAPEQVRGAGWLVEAWEAVKRFLGRLLPDFNPDAAGNDLLTWALFGLMVAVAAGILLHLTGATRGWRRGRVRGADLAAGGEGAGAHGAPEWEARARAAAAAGHWREAALALYPALVLRLDERGAVRFDDSKTPGDYRREARRGPLGRPFDQFLRGFEPVAFGNRPLDGSGYERLKAAAAEAGARG
jgi:hypothetical protein